MDKDQPQAGKQQSRQEVTSYVNTSDEWSSIPFAELITVEPRAAANNETGAPVPAYDMAREDEVRTLPVPINLFILNDISETDALRAIETLGPRLDEFARDGMYPPQTVSEINLIEELLEAKRDQTDALSGLSMEEKAVIKRLWTVVYRPDMISGIRRELNVQSKVALDLFDAVLLTYFAQGFNYLTIPPQRFALAREYGCGDWRSPSVPYEAEEPVEIIRAPTCANVCEPYRIYYKENVPRRSLMEAPPKHSLIYFNPLCFVSPVMWICIPLATPLCLFCFSLCECCPVEDVLPVYDEGDQGQMFSFRDFRQILVTEQSAELCCACAAYVRKMQTCQKTRILAPRPVRPTRTIMAVKSTALDGVSKGFLARCAEVLSRDSGRQ